VRRWNHRESLILDFGDAYLIDKVIDGFGLYKATDAMDYGNNDSVRAMLMFYILSQSANCYAQDWYDGELRQDPFPEGQPREPEDKRHPLRHRRRMVVQGILQGISSAGRERRERMARTCSSTARGCPTASISPSPR
jgi:hypothetical protein